MDRVSNVIDDYKYLYKQNMTGRTLYTKVKNFTIPPLVEGMAT